MLWVLLPQSLPRRRRRVAYLCPQGRAGDGAQMRAHVTVVQSQVGRAKEEAQGTEAYSAVSVAPVGINEPIFSGCSGLFTSEDPLCPYRRKHSMLRSAQLVGLADLDLQLPGCFLEVNLLTMLSLSFLICKKKVSL